MEIPSYPAFPQAPAASASPGTLPTAPLPAPAMKPSPTPAYSPSAAQAALRPRVPLPQARAAARASIQPGQRIAYAPAYPPTGGQMPTEQIAALEAVLPPEIEAILSLWPEKPQQIARDMFSKYGPPQDACDTRLVWINNFPWKVSIVYRDGIAHYWPTPHEDYLEQSIDFKVDPELYDEIAQFDGSVLPERTRGTLSARCDYEAANFLAINLARDIAVGEIGVEEAQNIYVEAAKMYAEGQEHPYMQGFLFELPQTYQGDPGKPIF